MNMTKHLVLSILIAQSLLAAGAARAVPLEDDRYTVSIDPGAGMFTVTDRASGKTVLADGKLSGRGGTAKAVAPLDPAFGRGNGVEVAYADGGREVVALFPALPFVTFRSTFPNRGGEALVLNHVPTVSAAVLGDIPLAQVRTLGTGGLLEPAKNPGSYAFLAVADPATRGGVVSGWLTHDRASGVVFSPVEGGAARVRAELDYGRLRIKPGEEAAGELFAIGGFDDARIGLEAYADAVAKVYAIHLPPHRPGYCTWYMEKHGGASNEQFLGELSDYAAKNLKPYGFDFVQIDDGWQQGIKSNGPKKNFTAFDPKGAYPSGMKEMARRISDLGLTPGIWFMPFAGNYQDPFFQSHTDWFVKGEDGKPFDTRWGGTCLDMTHPGARDYVREVVGRIGNEWSYRVFKMDGFWTGSGTRQMYVNNGYVDDHIGEAVFSNADKTNIEALRDGIKLVRRAAGPGTFLLGCCVSQNMRSFGGSFGLLDAMRVGPDTGSHQIGAPHASRLWFLNGRVWWNDPDCVSVRASTPLPMARLNASFTAIADDLFYNSDWMPDFPADRLDILRRYMPSHGLRSRPVDVFESPIARVWHLADTRSPQRRDIVALYNWDKAAAHVACTPERIGLPAADAYVGFDFWADQFIPQFKGELAADLPRESCQVLAIRPVSDHPQLISTSRHITQGMVDVTDESWDGSGVLSGVSQVVGEDPYELRIVMPAKDASWHLSGVNVAADAAAAGAKAEGAQRGFEVRVTIRCATSRAIKWSVRFTR